MSEILSCNLKILTIGPDGPSSIFQMHKEILLCIKLCVNKITHSYVQKQLDT